MTFEMEKKNPKPNLTEKEALILNNCYYQKTYKCFHTMLDLELLNKNDKTTKMIFSTRGKLLVSLHQIWLAINSDCGK